MPAFLKWTFDCDTDGVSGAQLIRTHHEFRGTDQAEGRLIAKVTESDTTLQAHLNFEEGRIQVNADLYKYFIVNQTVTGTGDPDQPMSAMLVFDPGTGVTSAAVNYTENSPRILFDLTRVPTWTGQVEVVQVRLKRGDLGASLDWPNVEWEIDWMALADSADYQPGQQDASLCVPFTLRKVGDQLTQYTPPGGKFFPGRDYSHTYEGYSIAACNWMKKAELNLTRTVTGPDTITLNQSMQRTGQSGYSFFWDATVDCANEELSPPRQWNYRSRMAQTAAGPALPLTEINKDGLLVEGVLSVTTNGVTSETPVGPKVTGKYNLFDAVQRLSSRTVPGDSFWLLDEHDQVRDEQTLTYHGQTFVELGGGQIKPLNCVLHKGPGILPTAFWTDQHGRLLFAITGMEIWQLTSEIQSGVGVWWDFDTPDDPEGWTANGSISSLEVNESHLRATVSGSEPLLTSPVISASATEYPFLYLGITNPVQNQDLQLVLYWSKSEKAFSPEQSITVDLTTGLSQSREVIIDMEGQPGWEGTITRLGVEVVNATDGESLAVDYIGLGAVAEPSPEQAANETNGWLVR